MNNRILIPVISLLVALVYATGVAAQAMYINPEGNVGLGLETPMSPMHVYRNNATQEFLFLESNEEGTVQDRAMMYLANNGGIRFEFNNPALGTAWRFQAATGGGDNFEVTKVGTGTIEFRVDADGNAHLAGLLFESSDRDAKTNITPVDQETILDKVASLPISQWAYKETPDSFHIGPMAQDFHAIFNTGDNDVQLATMDVGGVAIASIQALNEKLEQRNAELQAQNAALEKRLDLLEAMMVELLPNTAQN